jgi:hypothetical protein
MVAMQRRNGSPLSLGIIALLLACALPARADIPTGLTGVELGTPDPDSSFTTDATLGTITIKGGGGDIWGNDDEGFLVSRPITGDVTVTGRFVQKLVHPVRTPAKSGPMIRATTDVDAVSAYLPFQGDRLVDPHFRFASGDQTTNFEVQNRGHDPSPTTPLWQRLERQGNRISGLISNDGKIWNSIVSVTMDNMPAQTVAGLAANKHPASANWNPAPNPPDAPVTVVYDNFAYGTDLSPENVTGVAQDKGAVVTWNAVTGADGYNVYTQGTDGKLTKVTTTPTKNTSMALTSLTNGQATTVVVSAVIGGKEGIGVEAVVTPAAPIGGGLTGININTIDPGSASMDASGVITVHGDGHAIGLTSNNTVGGQSDGFYYLAMPLTGDATATVRLVDGPNGPASRDDSGRQAGIMIRESLDQDARFVMMDTTSGNGTELQARSKASDLAAQTDAGVADSTARPVWLRVVRKGVVFTGFVSEDGGKTFRQVGDPVTITGFSGTAYVGLAVCPHNGFSVAEPGGPELATAKFDNLTIK